MDFGTWNKSVRGEVPPFAYNNMKPFISRNFRIIRDKRKRGLSRSLRLFETRQTGGDYGGAAVANGDIH
jgi:hypothetical protein